MTPLTRMLTLKPDRALAQPTPNPEYFAGAVFMQPLVTREASEELDVIAVFFEDGARTIPHTHTTDQLLIVVEGVCRVGDESGTRTLEAGECVLLPAHAWHWHGAVPGRSMCHLSIRKPGPSDWNQPKRDW